MSKDLKILAVFTITTSLWFLLNPVQDTEIAIKLKQLCMDSNIPCEEIKAHCLETLRKGNECYLTNK